LDFSFLRNKLDVKTYKEATEYLKEQDIFKDFKIVVISDELPPIFCSKEKAEKLNKAQVEGDIIKAKLLK
jgi:hypothetical protein